MYDHYETEELLAKYKTAVRSPFADFGDVLLMLKELEAREAF